MSKLEKYQVQSLTSYVSISTGVSSNTPEADGDITGVTSSYTWRCRQGLTPLSTQPPPASAPLQPQPFVAGADKAELISAWPLDAQKKDKQRPEFWSTPLQSGI